MGHREIYNSPPYDLVGSIISRRMKWLGKLLRADESFLPRRVAIAEFLANPESRYVGSIFTGTPEMELEELISMAGNRKIWKMVENRSLGHIMSYR